jgi:hypothetical protein
MAQRGVFVPIEKATLVDLYWDRGVTLGEIAGELGVSLRTVHRRMIEAGILRRNMGLRPARYSPVASCQSAVGAVAIG